MCENTHRESKKFNCSTNYNKLFKNNGVKSIWEYCIKKERECNMRIWEKIKVNDIVVYKDEKHIVQKIYEIDGTMYAELKNINSGNICRAALYGCSIYDKN